MSPDDRNWLCPWCLYDIEEATRTAAATLPQWAAGTSAALTTDGNESDDALVEPPPSQTQGVCLAVKLGTALLVLV